MSCFVVLGGSRQVWDVEGRRGGWKKAVSRSQHAVSTVPDRNGKRGYTRHATPRDLQTSFSNSVEAENNPYSKIWDGSILRIKLIGSLVVLEIRTRPSLVLR